LFVRRSKSRRTHSCASAHDHDATRGPPRHALLWDRHCGMLAAARGAPAGL
jgi:hypothetical protein